jgi:hypothetical protein
MDEKQPSSSIPVIQSGYMDKMPDPGFIGLPSVII